MISFLAPLERVIQFGTMFTLAGNELLDRNAFSAAAGRCTSTSLMPKSWRCPLDLSELKRLTIDQPSPSYRFDQPLQFRSDQADSA